MMDNSIRRGCSSEYLPSPPLFRYPVRPPLAVPFAVDEGSNSGWCACHSENLFFALWELFQWMYTDHLMGDRVLVLQLNSPHSDGT